MMREQLVPEQPQVPNVNTRVSGDLARQLLRQIKRQRPIEAEGDKRVQRQRPDVSQTTRQPLHVSEGRLVCPKADVRSSGKPLPAGASRHRRLRTSQCWCGGAARCSADCTTCRTAHATRPGSSCGIPWPLETATVKTSSDASRISGLSASDRKRIYASWQRRASHGFPAHSPGSNFAASSTAAGTSGGGGTSRNASKWLSARSRASFISAPYGVSGKRWRSSASRCAAVCVSL